MAAIVPAAQQGVQQQLQQLQVGLQQQLQQLQVGLQQQLQQQLQEGQQQLQQLQEGQQQLQQQLQAQGVGLFNTIARTYNRRTLVTDQLMPLRMEVPAAGAEGAGDFGDLPDAGVFPQTWDDTSGVRAGGDVVCWRPTICSAQRSRWRRARLRARSGFATRFNPRPACRYALSDSLSPLPARVQWGHARLDAVAAFYQQDFAAGATGEPLLAVRVAVCHVKGRLLCDVCPNLLQCQSARLPCATT